ncbi:MAG: DUF2914 domain-containing protein [Deltaproteobacteria bacterium]|nr:MAG: DUF2914 domain-containing protein [Deltaproteobacteria bacterium]
MEVEERDPSPQAGERSEAATPPETQEGRGRLRLPPRLAAVTGRVQTLREAHPRLEIALFFTAGFLFDVFTLGRIDDAMTLAMQGAYLFLLAALLLVEQWAELAQPKLPRLLEPLWPFREDAIHFLLGSLLSAYSLFYLRSASHLSTVLFMAVVFALLIGNELPEVRRLGPVVRLALFSFCLTSFLAYLLPVLAGRLSRWWFFLSAGLALAVSLGGAQLLSRWSGERRLGWKRAALPGAAVQAGLVALFVLDAVPPVPLSVRHLGVYHHVERAGDHYVLRHEKPAWRFFEEGDQHFYARPGDRVWIFARIFAPAEFQDSIYMVWEYDHPKTGWTRTDRIRMKITGGREAGYRAFAYKEHWREGEWRVSIETSDGRTLGRIGVHIERDPRGEAPRTFHEERAVLMPRCRPPALSLASRPALPREGCRPDRSRGTAA